MCLIYHVNMQTNKPSFVEATKKGFDCFRETIQGIFAFPQGRINLILDLDVIF